MTDRRNLFNKVWDAHSVRSLASGQTQLFIGLHLIHEVTSPQAFSMLRDRGLKALFPERTLATVDHIVPTENQARPFLDVLAEEMMSAIESNSTPKAVEVPVSRATRPSSMSSTMAMPMKTAPDANSPRSACTTHA